MLVSSKYEDPRWIRIKRATPVVIDGVSYVPEEHHIEETKYLIDEIKLLAVMLDKEQMVNTVAEDEFIKYILYLKNCIKEHEKQLAESRLKENTPMSLALRLGFMPEDDEDAEEIIETIILEVEKRSDNG